MICTKVMALRVLLADENNTLKKAFQIALGAFNPDVKSVHSGLDVISIALDFKPDIIFADVMLSKKNGYEVCAEIKKHPSLHKTPVVLLWSSFLEFNEKLASEVKCNSRLEKPFETEALISLIENLVPVTTTHPLRNKLEFAPLPEFIDIPPSNLNDFSKTTENITLRSNTSPSDESSSSRFKPVIETFDPNPTFSSNHKEKEKEEAPFDNSLAQDVFSDETSPDEVYNLEEETFEPVQLKNNPSQRSLPPTAKIQNPQSPGISKKPVQPEIHLETESYGEFEEVVLVKSDKTTDDLQTRIQEQLKNYVNSSPVALNKIQNTENQQADRPKALTRFEEQIMREEARLMAEKICWQLIPEITEKLVKEELKKLLQDIEKSL